MWHPQHAGGCLAVPGKARTKTIPSVIDEKLGMMELQELIQKGLDSLLELRTFEENLENFSPN